MCSSEKVENIECCFFYFDSFKTGVNMMSVDEMTVNMMSVDKMTVMSVDEMTENMMSVDEMTVNECLQMN